MQRSRIALLVAIGITIIAGASVYWLYLGPAEQQHRIRMLAYVGYDEREFLGPIEHALNISVSVDTYASGEEMYSKFTQSPAHTYDVVVLDAEYGKRLFDQKRIISLDPALWRYDDHFKKFQNGDPARVADSVYAVAARWGSIGMVFNYSQVDRSRMNTFNILFDSDLKGHIGIFDWYLPNMGVLSLAQGNVEPYNIDETALSALQTYLFRLRPQVASIQPSPGQVLDDLRTGIVSVAPGIGEWAAAALAAQGLPIDWVVPKEGGIMWVEAFSIPSDSTNLALAKAFVAEVMKPANLALLATRKAYFSQITRASAYQFIPANAKQYLKATNLDDVQTLSEMLQFRYLPGPKTTEQDWLAVWTNFKSGTK